MFSEVPSLVLRPIRPPAAGLQRQGRGPASPEGGEVTGVPRLPRAQAQGTAACHENPNGAPFRPFLRSIVCRALGRAGVAAAGRERTCGPGCGQEAPG